MVQDNDGWELEADEVAETVPVVQETKALAVISHTGNNILDIEGKAKEVEARVDLIKRIIPTLCKLCEQGDITDYGGKPFIGDNACQKIARVMAISFAQPQIISEWIDDPETTRRVYSVVISGSASLFGQSVDALGGCDSEDKFFTKKNQETGGYERRSGLSFTNLKLAVQKKALANWRGSCVRTLLGLKNLEWSALEASGFRRGEGGSVTFKKDGKAPVTEASSDVKKNIGDMILKDCNGDKKLAGDVLSEITSFDGDKGHVKGPTSTGASNFSDKWAFRVWSEIKPGGKNHEAYLNMVKTMTGKEIK